MSIESHRDILIQERICSGRNSEVISVEEWKRRKIIWQEVTSRPKCKNCGRKLSAQFQQVLTQRFDPEERFHEEFGDISDSGIRIKPDYSDFIGFGHRDKGVFCNGKCCERFAYRVCDQFKEVA